MFKLSRIKLEKKYLLFIFLEIFLFSLIVFLGFKIIKLRESRVKENQFVWINKEFVQFDSKNNQLKYFYEPKVNSLEKWHPDWLGYEVINTINKDSLNERFDYTVQKPDNTFRIITLGDSFTFGQYVNTADNYSEKLEDRLNSELRCTNYEHFEVINLGLYGYDLEYTVERFIKRGIKYNPDLVILSINNWNLYQIKEIVTPKERELKAQGVPENYNSNGQILYKRRSDAIKESYKNITKSFISKYEQKILKRFSNAYKGKLVFFTFQPLLPENINLVKDFISNNSNYKYSKILEEDHYWTNPLYRLPDGHPSEKGHNKIAERIFKFLTDNYFSNCQSSYKAN